VFSEASALGNSGGEHFYNMSQAMAGTASLEGFISYARASSGSGIALVLYLQQYRASVPAVTLTWGAALVAMALSREQGSGTDHAGVLTVVVTTLATVLVYVAFAFFSHKLPCFSTWSPSRYFLDTCVIHQTDTKLKSKGAYHLGEFVMASKELIVCWTPLYNTRLWCVMELATFSRRALLLKGLLHRDPRREIGRIVLLPLWAPRMLFTFSFCVLTLCFVPWLLIPGGHNEALQVIIASIAFCAGGAAFIVGALCMLRYRLHASEMVKRFENFSLKDSKCGWEEDRAMLLEYIRVIWRFNDTDDGCAVFEKFVRE
jgi:hypothetical protein